MSSDLRRLQSELMGYLVNKESKAKDYIAEGGLIDTDKRLQIYGSAYRIRLRGVIDTDHELLSFYLGDDLFDKFVDEYIAQYPSQVPSLRDFCQHVPKFLKENPPFSDHPILSELARFEQMLLFSFDANDADTVAQEKLSEVPLEAWPDMQLRFHPSVQIFSTHTNCVETWQALKNKETPPPAVSDIAAHWIVWRSLERITEFRSLQLDEMQMMNAFLRGNDLASVCEELLETHAEEEVSRVAINYITQWMSRGQVARLLWDKR